MEKRVLLAVVLSFVVLYGYQALFPPPKPQTQGRSRNWRACGSAGHARRRRPNAAAAHAEAAPKPAAAPAAAALVADSDERDIRFENESVTRGVHHARRRAQELAAEEVSGRRSRTARADPAERPGRDRSCRLRSPCPTPPTSATLAQALFKPSATEVRVTSAPATLTFEYQDASGLTAHKEFSFVPTSPYVIDFSATVTQGGTRAGADGAVGPGARQRDRGELANV